MYKRIYKSSLKYAPLVLPLLLLPLFAEWIWKVSMPEAFEMNRELILIVDIIYILIVRILLLDTMLFIFTRSRHVLHVTLIRIVGLYLEITVITILYFALLFYLLDVFQLFHYNAAIAAAALADIQQHDFLVAVYISTVTFTTLGLGDWVPQTLNAMMAVSVEVILGVVQAGVFMAIVIYALQNREVVEPRG
jgi:hypothetical protein